jgi:hypothetical protein
LKCSETIAAMGMVDGDPETCSETS